MYFQWIRVIALRKSRAKVQSTAPATEKLLISRCIITISAKTALFTLVCIFGSALVSPCTLGAEGDELC
jgi:hypothetical protein